VWTISTFDVVLNSCWFHNNLFLIVQNSLVILYTTLYFACNKKTYFLANNSSTRCIINNIMITFSQLPRLANIESSDIKSPSSLLNLLIDFIIDSQVLCRKCLKCLKNKFYSGGSISCRCVSDTIWCIHTMWWNERIHATCTTENCTFYTVLLNSNSYCCFKTRLLPISPPSPHVTCRYLMLFDTQCLHVNMSLSSISNVHISCWKCILVLRKKKKGLVLLCKQPGSLCKRAVLNEYVWYMYHYVG